MRLRRWSVVGHNNRTGQHFSWADFYVLRSFAETDARFFNQRIQGATYSVYRWDAVPPEAAHLLAKSGKSRS